MTRRLRPQRPLLTVDAYIHRATLGLPQAERLDTAAELRAHLLERTSEHQAQGFSREEDEFLAVRGMGDPHPVNRRLLGHALTHRAGWLVLTLLVAGGGGWWAYREWLPPRVGISNSDMTADDARFLFTQPKAPRGDYLAYTITYPKGTKSVVAAFISEDRRELQVLDVSDRQDRTLPGSYRFQQRWLIQPAVTSTNLPWWPYCRNTGLYFVATEVRSPLVHGGVAGGQLGGMVPYGACDDREKELAAQLPLTRQPNWLEQPMALNRWTLIFSGAAGFNNIDRSLSVLVMPLDYSIQTKYPFVQADAGRPRLIGDTRPLPPLPALP